MRTSVLAACVVSSLVVFSAAAEDKVFKAPVAGENYAAEMKKVAAKFKGTAGVYLHLGDSITYANQNTAFERNGQGLTDEERKFVTWSHAGEKNDKDGYYLASFDAADGRSFTAASGCRANELLEGGKHGMSSLADIIKKYDPEMALYMLGTNDINGGRPVADFIADVERAIDMLLANGTVPIISTLPPIKGKIDQVEQYNRALRELVIKKKVPVIDLFGEMKARNGDNIEKYLAPDGVHMSYDNPAGPATEENLKTCGYLIRGYLAVHKGMEVKARVFDGGGDEAKTPEAKTPEAKKPEAKKPEAKKSEPKKTDSKKPKK